MNLDNRSIVLNDEAALMVFDAGIGDEMQAIFDDLRHADEVRLDTFRTRGIHARVQEQLARLLAPLI